MVCLFLNYKRTEVSNDAQIEQYISPVNLRASGYISKIYFTEHQRVHKGDTLLVLDDREYKIRVLEAEAPGSRSVGGLSPVWPGGCYGDGCHTANHADYGIRLRCFYR